MRGSILSTRKVWIIAKNEEIWFETLGWSWTVAMDASMFKDTYFVNRCWAVMQSIYIWVVKLIIYVIILT